MTKRPIITKPMDLSQYNAEYTESYLYLSYVYNRGYMLIRYSYGSSWFSAIEINMNPQDLSFKMPNEMDLFNEDLLTNDYEEYQIISKEVKKAFKQYETVLRDNNKLPHEIEETITKLAYNFLLDKLDELTELDLSNHFTQVKDYPNVIKEFVLDPVTVFNKWVDVPRLTAKEEKAKKLEIENEIKEALSDVLFKFNEYKDIYLDDKFLSKEIGKLAKESISDPFLNLHLGYKQTHSRNIASELIVQDFGLKRHLSNNKSITYMYNHNLRYFEKITTENLKHKIYKRYGFNISHNDLEAVLKGISTEDKLYKNLIVLKNLYFDTDTLAEFKPMTYTYRRQDYLTLNTIGTLNKDNQVELLNFDLDLDYLTVSEVKDIPIVINAGNKDYHYIESAFNDTVKIDIHTPVNEYQQKYGMTLTEIVLRQILIPKNNPADLTLFVDFLQRFGSNIMGENTQKVITYYYADGDNGKSILNLFYELIYNNSNYEIRPEALKDGFNLPNFENKLVINIDEITADSFDELKAELKKATSEYSKFQARQIFSDEDFIKYGFPNFNIYSNVTLNLDINDDRALFGRIDYLKLPNQFVTPKELNNTNNAYPKLNGLGKLLRQDKQGLSWLITASILSFRAMQLGNESYICRQTKDETIDIFLGEDYLTKFLLAYTDYDENLDRANYTSSTDIVEQYIQYMDLKGKDIDKDKTKISKQLGLKIKNLYPINNKQGKFKKDGKITMYQLKLKSFEDVAIEYKKVYEINEYLSDAQADTLSNLNTDLKNVYYSIQQGVNTINKLNGKYPSNDNIDLLKQLLSLNLIEKTDKTAVDEFNKETDKNNGGK